MPLPYINIAYIFFTSRCILYNFNLKIIYSLLVIINSFIIGRIETITVEAFQSVKFIKICQTTQRGEKSHWQNQKYFSKSISVG